MVKVQIGKTQIQIDGGKVSAVPPMMTLAFQQALAMDAQSGADPDQDYAAAERLINRFGGEIVSAASKPEALSGVVY